MLGAQGPSSAFYGTFSATCAAKCSYGGNWSCAGHVVWPKPHATTTTIVLEGVHEGPTGKRIDGAAVWACAQSDPDCNAPLDKETTDAGGSVTLQVPTAQSNVNMPTGQLVFLKFAATGYLPSYQYFNFPLSEETLTVSPANSMYMLTSEEFARDGGQDPTLGTVFAGSLDCLGALGPSRINVSLDALDAGQLTNAAGVTVFTNVPVGNTLITAVPVGLGIPSSRTTLYVHGGGPTAAAVVPTP
jgi:hypothetical protein